MKIGDHVRLIHGTEEGIIRRINNNRIIEVEIEDGFLIPVLKNEVTVISLSEKESFDDLDEEIGQSSPKKNISDIEDSDIFLAIEQLNTKLTLWIVNHTNNTLLFSIHAELKNKFSGISHGDLRPGNYAKIDEWELTMQNDWPLLHINLIEHFREVENISEPASINFDLTHKILRKTPVLIPSMDRKGIVYSLTQDSSKLNPQTIKEALYTEEPQKISKDYTKSHSKPKEIDLHIEEIVKDGAKMDSDNILHLQLEHFEKKLDEAVIHGMEQITFIHGIGNGSLRNAIHKKLSSYPHINYFEDAQKEKFGYGATKVYLK